MNQYVLGFLFSPSLYRVVLIKKTKPEWQAGKLNGVGGKIEEGELPEVAMEREFVEETGIHISAAEWIRVCAVQFDYDSPEGATVHVFAAIGDWVSMCPHKGTPEGRARWFSWEEDTKCPVIPNLRWLIPLCRTVLRPGERECFRLVTPTVEHIK